MTHASVFMNGNSQSVRLPQSCRFAPGTRRLNVRRIGRAVLLEPEDALEWDPEYWAALAAMPPMEEDVVPVAFQTPDIQDL